VPRWFSSSLDDRASSFVRLAVAVKVAMNVTRRSTLHRRILANSITGPRPKRV